MRPLGELSYWKAADFRLFALYAGICILKNKDILSKEKYLHYLHFAAALRLLTSAQTTDSDMTVCSSLLSTFVTKCSALYGCGFLTYNVHSLIHLPDDFKRFGSLDYVSCFPFESYLGLLKECVHSGYKPLSQVATHAHHMNENLLNMIKMQKDFICQDYLHNTNDECHLPPALQGQNIKKYRKTLQSNDCIIIPMSTADSTIMVNDYVAKVFDIFEVPPKKFLTVKKYKYVKCCFKHPIKSSIVGIFEIFELSSTFEWIELEECITKCFIMPFKNKFIAIQMIHSF